MINKLIEKYKAKIRIGEEAKTQAKKVGSAKTVIKYNFREDIYREILQDLEELRESCKEAFNNRIHFVELQQEYLNRKIIGIDKERWKNDK